MAAFGFGATGTVVLAGSGLTPARLLLVPAGTRLPPSVHPVAVAFLAPAGSGSRAMGLVARAAAGAGHVGDPTKAAGTGALDSFSIHDADSLSVHAAAATAAGNGALAYLSVDDATKSNGGARSSLSVLGATNGGAGVLSSLSAVHSTRAAAGFATRASAGPGLLFFGGDASASFGVSSAALASSAGGRASRGGGLVVAATAGSESEADDDWSAPDPAKVALFLKKKKEVLLSWEFVDVDRDYKPQGFFADLHMFEDSANKGIKLMGLLLDAGLDYSNDQMWVLSYAGQCLRRVAVQAERGFVYDGAVMEASQALKLVCVKLLPHVPIASASDPIVAYAKQRAQDFNDLVDGVEVAVTPLE